MVAGGAKWAYDLVALSIKKGLKIVGKMGAKNFAKKNLPKLVSKLRKVKRYIRKLNSKVVRVTKCVALGVVTTSAINRIERAIGETHV